MSEAILRTVNLSKDFYRSRGTIFRKRTALKAVSGVDLELRKGRILAVIGESGCGKSTLGYLIARIYEPSGGEIWLGGEDISRLAERDLKRIRRKIQMVFQDPGSSLNPVQKVETILSLPFKVHLDLSKKDLKLRVLELLDIVNLPREMTDRYPLGLSGGEKQRVGIARALALHPEVIVLDEPTSALDVSVQAKILHLLKELQQKLELTYLFITHNLCLVKNLADEVLVMYLGRVVERAETLAMFRAPLHPYTKALLSAIPTVTVQEEGLIPEEIILEGELPSPEEALNHCAFYSRCQRKMKHCKELPEPQLKEIESRHFARCHLL